MKRRHSSAIVSTALGVAAMVCACVSGIIERDLAIVIAASVIGAASLIFLIWSIARYRRAE